MGTYHDWRISFNTHKKSATVIKELKEYTDKEDDDISWTLDSMLNDSIVRQDENVLEFSGTNEKFENWDDVLGIIDKLFGNDSEIDYGSILISPYGEEVNHGNFTCMGLIKDVGETSFEEVPACIKTTVAKMKTKEICKCDISQLMRDGHDSDCPERTAKG